MGGTGVSVGGTGVSVGAGVSVGGTGVAVGGIGVLEGGIGVSEGGTGVRVAVGGTGVAGGTACAPPHPARINTTTVKPNICCNSFVLLIVLLLPSLKAIASIHIGRLALRAE